MRITAFQQKFWHFKQNEQLKTTTLKSKWRDIIADKKLQRQKGSVNQVRVNYTKQLHRCLPIITRLLHCLDKGKSQYQFPLRVYKNNLELLSKQVFARFVKEENRFGTSLLMIVDEVRSIINTIGNEPEHKMLC
jgi:hypothetical protein